jgi:spore coat polysaccharide biosynthesis protein SpsF
MITVDNSANVIAFIQARVSSSRLPGKVLMPILAKPMLQHQIERVQLSRMIDKLVVVTSTEPSDDQLIKLLKKINVEFYRGSIDNVLDRFYQAACYFQAKHIVRLTGDCPVIDAKVIDDAINFHLKGGFDYTSNTLEPTFPDGLDVEVLQFSTLENAWKNAKLQSELEHVTSYIYKHPELFSLGNFKCDKDLSGFRWTVDEMDDFKKIFEIYQALYPQNQNFSLSDILNLFKKNPEIRLLNKDIRRNEGYQKSIEKDNI